MDFIASSITSKYQLTLPRMVRETLDVTGKDQVVFLVEGKSVMVIKKPEDIMKAMRELSGDLKVSAKEIREEIRKGRSEW